MSISNGKLKIGEVHAALREQFPDIELSKLRYYEDRGLVVPSRSKKGYRLYSERDVACLREAIRLAQEEFIPLRVIRFRLIEQGLLDDTPVAPALRQVARANPSNVVSISTPERTVQPLTLLPTAEPPRHPAVSPATSKYYTLSEFTKATGLDVESVRQLQSAGLIVSESLSNDEVFSDVDVRIGYSLSGLIDRGVDVRILGALRRVVDREVGVLEDIIASQPSLKSADGAREVATELAGELGQLRAALHERALNKFLGN